MMSTLTIILLLALGVALVIGSFLVRALSDGKLEIKTADLVFLVIPLLLVALATGKIKGLDLFGVKADLSEIWAQAAQADVQKQVGARQTASIQDVIHVTEVAQKGGIEELQRLIERKVEALQFELGYSGYYAPAIKTYFDALSGSSHLRYVVLINKDGSMYGMYEAADLIGYLRVAGDEAYKQFRGFLASGDDRARKELAKLPGFIPVKDAITPEASKREALAKMEDLNVESLPVVSKDRHFAGTVQRGKLMASLMLSVTNKLEGR